MPRDVSLSVLVPALNEEKHLQQTIDAIRQAVGTTVEDVEMAQGDGIEAPWIDRDTPAHDAGSAPSVARCKNVRVVRP